MSEGGEGQPIPEQERVTPTEATDEFKNSWESKFFNKVVDIVPKFGAGLVGATAAVAAANGETRSAVLFGVGSALIAGMDWLENRRIKKEDEGK